MPLAQKYDEFLEDLLRKVSSSAPLSGFAFDKYRMPSALQTGTASVVPNGVFGKKDEVGTAEEA
jgi:hypothetical protein